VEVSTARSLKAGAEGGIRRLYRRQALDHALHI